MTPHQLVGVKVWRIARQEMQCQASLGRGNILTDDRSLVGRQAVQDQMNRLSTPIHHLFEQLATCEDVADRGKKCEVVKLGMHLMVKGPTKLVVHIKAQELVHEGARLISAPSEATGGGWVAICDDTDQITSGK